mmetsp:Transcript_27288/g.60129  ORF Transcript_27288/g.60129 Transcript_27288/m.60129 type:complete len:235 (-) Transcript_27288:725-1429(-)
MSYSHRFTSTRTYVRFLKENHGVSSFSSFWCGKMTMVKLMMILRICCCVCSSSKICGLDLGRDAVFCSDCDPPGRIYHHHLHCRYHTCRRVCALVCRYFHWVAPFCDCHCYYHSYSYCNHRHCHFLRRLDADGDRDRVCAGNDHFFVRNRCRYGNHRNWSTRSHRVAVVYGVCDDGSRHHYYHCRISPGDDGADGDDDSKTTLYACYVCWWWKFFSFPRDHRVWKEECYSRYLW